MNASLISADNSERSGRRVNVPSFCQHRMLSSQVRSCLLRLLLLLQQGFEIFHEEKSFDLVLRCMMGYQRVCHLLRCDRG